MKTLEKLAYLDCMALFWALRLIGRIHAALIKILSTALALALLLAGVNSIGNLQQPWQSLTLQALVFGAALQFIFIMTLAIRKPESFDKLLARYHSKCR